MSLNPDNPQFRVALGLMQLSEGDYKNGWKSVEARFQLSDRLSPLVNSPVAKWNGESLAGKNILIWNDPWHGLGDGILLVRYLPELAERAKREGGLILLCCHEPLYTLFARNLAVHCNEIFVRQGPRE